MPRFAKENKTIKIAKVYCDVGAYEAIFAILSNVWHSLDVQVVIFVGRRNNPKYTCKTGTARDFIDSIGFEPTRFDGSRFAKFRQAKSLTCFTLQN